MKFKGSENPKIYILDYHNNPEEFMQEYPLSGQRGEFVTSLLGSFGLLDKVRVGNPEIQGKMIVEDDIVEKDPELIIGFGSHAVSDYINSRQKITELSGNIFDIKIKDKEYKLLILISPSYVLKKIDDSELSLRFSKDLYKAKQIIDGQYIDILKEKIVKSAHSFDEFKELYENNLKDINEIGYDIETNARPAMMRDSRIIGFSIGSKDFGIYVSIDSIDFHMSKDEEDKIWDYLINEIFEKKDKLIIHNTMYERPYTYYCKNYEISFEKAHDTLVMARLLKSPKETAGLKYQAQKYLFYPDWETDLGRYISGFRGLVERIGLGPKKFNDFYEKIRTNQINIFDETAVTADSSFTSLTSLDQEEILDIINCCKTVLVDIYSEDEIEELGRLIQEKVVETVDLGGVRDSTIPYNYVPDRVLSRYGAIDAIATADLKDYFFGIMDKESTEEVDLHKGYHNWLEHIYVAYIMERNGMYWNDDLAQRDRDFLSKQAYQCLKELLLSPCFDQFIIPVEEWRYRPIIFSDYLPMIPVSQGFEVIYSRDTNSYVLKKDGKRIQKGRINEIQIPNNFKNQYEKIVRELFYDEINSSKDFKDLKELYNPGSPTSSDIPRKIFVDEYLQMGGRINELHTLSISPSFEKIKDKIPYLDQKFLTTANYCCNVDLLKEQFGDNWAYNRKLFYEGFWNLYNSQRKFVTTPEIRRILDNKCPVEIESFDDNGVITIFDNLVVQGVDPDDSSTYNDKFKWLINFRIFKKAIKIISTYIDGSTGREAVTIVNKGDLNNGCHKTYRERFYAEGTARDGEGYLLMSKWGPNTAETGRWRSNFHTLPWTSPVKKYYESRFLGGCTCSPDYSTMEVRTLAAISKDQNMLDLFARGEDFHTNTASSIFRKPKDEITPTERRFSKTGTFSILYGSTVESFANKYCQGDISYAKQVYDGFFSAYPGAKHWMDERHKEVMKDHRVSLNLSDRFIPIVPEGDNTGAINAMLRKSVNYCVQGMSADITGCVIFDLQKYIEEHNLKSLVFMYVHDSIEVDIYPFEMLEFFQYLKVLLNEAPRRRMGLISEAEIALGKSLGDEIELTELIVSDDKASGILKLKGYKDEIDETVENWKKAYKTVEVSDEEYKDVYTSVNELFMLKKAYSFTVGTHRKKGTCTVKIDYYK